MGGVGFPVMLKRLFDQVRFGWAVRVVGFLMMGCLIMANFLVRSRIPPPGWIKERRFVDIAAFKEPVFCFVAISFPLPRAKFDRLGWRFLRFLPLHATGIYTILRLVSGVFRYSSILP
jgi:hypothetical protein